MLIQRQLCGAKLQNRPGFCRGLPLRGKRRCRLHGGKGGAPYNPRGWQPGAHRGRDKKQAVLRALGLPWYGGAPKQKVTLSMAEKAIRILDETVALLPEPRDVPDAEKGDVEIFAEGVRASCILLRDTVRLGQRLMRDEEGNAIESVAQMHPQNLKFLGMAQITALGVTKQGWKAADRSQRNVIIGNLLAAIAAEKAEGGK
jgi:hypothetical protein